MKNAMVMFVDSAARPESIRYGEIIERMPDFMGYVIRFEFEGTSEEFEYDRGPDGFYYEINGEAVCAIVEQK